MEVKSGNEEEEIVCTYCSKLYLNGETLLDKGTEIKTWVEHGIGYACILCHCGNGRLRFVMRQEETMKVLANHAFNSHIELKPITRSDKSWTWGGLDAADGDVAEKVFALRFSNLEIAEEFKAKFEECKAEMLAKEDATIQAEAMVNAFGGKCTNSE
ncbi:hypothetical protein ACHAWU_004925 [Discostella pseudostelligera]|uniref:RanBD1 domain-containing protein n=1 Tax=Discostella pseudostelligera TaxID=259834 RepID=A0ABD3MK50_9STRA